jgi:membrane-associated HD superfamily phosphohydrolase
MTKQEERELFTGKPAKEEETKPISLVSFIGSEEEEQQLAKEAEKARKRAMELINKGTFDENGEFHSATEPENLVEWVEDPKKKSDPNEKKYLILMIGETRDNAAEEFRDWMLVKGRKSAYEAICAYMESDSYDFDLVESKILVDVEKLEQAKSIYDFMDFVIKNDLMGPDTQYPHLDEYVGADILEEEE